MRDRSIADKWIAETRNSHRELHRDLRRWKHQVLAGGVLFALFLVFARYL